MPPRTGIQAQRDHIESEARKLAHSGEHSSWRSIERALIKQSLVIEQVAHDFKNAWTRSELDRLCQRARLLRKEHAMKKPRPLEA